MEHTILLVDDEEDIGASLARLLRPDGYRILRASSGEEALALLAQHDVGVVISDQRMPGMTGVELLSMVRELYPNVVRIVLSGYTDIESMKAAINKGAIYKFFTKPWENEALRAEVLEAFRYFELAQEKKRLMREIQIANEMLAQVNLEWVEAVAQRDRQIDRISRLSPITDLPNRQAFTGLLESGIEQSRQVGRLLAVFSINLDRFRQVNDSFGQPLGDVLLQIVAARMKNLARANDTVAHLGGDAFALVLTDVSGARDATGYAQRLLDAFVREPIKIGESEVFISMGIGIALYPADGIEASLLLKNADAALNHVKEEGGGGFQYYTPNLNDATWRNLTMETALHRALERGEFILYYQPLVNALDYSIAGMEALLRWQSPEYGLVEPGRFIPLLEKSGLILPVGAWVIDEACRQTSEWRTLKADIPSIAVNVSTLQLRQPDFVGMVRNALHKHDLGGQKGAIGLELTESMLIKNMDGTLFILELLRESGIGISIDDFGTGYSCMNYLKRLPVSKLKIDQSFVCNVPGKREDVAIVQAIIALGKGLGLDIVAEGVETLSQYNFIRESGCDEIQGYLFSRPVPPWEMTRLLMDSEAMRVIEEA